MNGNDTRPVPLNDVEARIVLLLIVPAATAVAAILATTVTVVVHPAWVLLAGIGAAFFGAVAVAGVMALSVDDSTGQYLHYQTIGGTR